MVVALPTRYDILYTYVPRRFVLRSSRGAGRSPAYPTLSLERIIEFPAADLAARDSVLLF